MNFEDKLGQIIEELPNNIKDAIANGICDLPDDVEESAENALYQHIHYDVNDVLVDAMWLVDDDSELESLIFDKIRGQITNAVFDELIGRFAGRRVH